MKYMNGHETVSMNRAPLKLKNISMYTVLPINFPFFFFLWGLSNFT